MAQRSLSKSVALVTGASSGLGKSFVKALLSQGVIVYAAARRVDQMSDLAALGATVLAMDITSEEQIVAAVRRIEAEHGSVDILINNAGFGLYGAMEETPIAEARLQFEVNFFGMARLTQLVLPSMRAKMAGRIINISSMGGIIYGPLASWYHATKHAIEGWSDSLRVELTPFHIDVVIVEPGVIMTEFAEVTVPILLQRSGSGPYATMAKSLGNAMKKIYQPGSASDPQVITNLIVKAVTASKPKTRYVAGKFAKPLIFMRRRLGDRMFDKILLSQMR